MLAVVLVFDSGYKAIWSTLDFRHFSRIPLPPTKPQYHYVTAALIRNDVTHLLIPCFLKPVLSPELVIIIVIG